MRTLERETNIKPENSSMDKLPPMLCSVYLASCVSCQDILSANKIAADCYEPYLHSESVAIEELDKCVFLFYGKPVFLSKDGEISTKVTSQSCLPCCIVLDTEKIFPNHIYPFAINACPPGFRISDFDLGTSLSAIPKHIKRYFKDNCNYLMGKCKIDADTIRDPVESEMWSLFSNIEKTNEAKTVEILCSEIELSNTIEAIIIPESVSRFDKYATYFNQHKNIKMLKYYDHYPCMPGSFDEVLFQKLIDYYKKKRKLKRLRVS